MTSPIPTSTSSSSSSSSSTSTSTSTANTGVATQTQVIEETKEAHPQTRPPLILRLQKAPTVTWTADTIDNEHLNRKSSKRCCIFHKQKAFGESDSDETDSDGEVNPNKPPDYQRFHA